MSDLERRVVKLELAARQAAAPEPEAWTVDYYQEAEEALAASMGEAFVVELSEALELPEDERNPRQARLVNVVGRVLTSGWCDRRRAILTGGEYPALPILPPAALEALLEHPDADPGGAHRCTACHYRPPSAYRDCRTVILLDACPLCGGSFEYYC